MSELSIMLVDDHPVVREGYRRLLERRAGTRVVAEAGDAAEAYRLYKTSQPDVTVMDLSLPGPGGLEAVRHIRQFDPKAKILVFSMHQGAAYAKKAFEAGALGFVTKSSAPDDLLAAVTRVAAGERAMSADIAREIADDALGGTGKRIDGLTPRETEILRLLAIGMPAERIADRLSVSLKTIQNNHYQIKAKLGAATDAQLVWVAIEAGLLADRMAS